MMTEPDVIAKIRELRQIKPRKDWVLLTKERILGKEEIARDRVSGNFSFIDFLKEIQRGERFIFQHKPAFATLLSLTILIGLFGFVQNSLPGDALFSIKKITEQSQAVFVSEKEQPKRNLELVNKRLDDLTKIAQTNAVKNLAPAINEFQASVSKAAESLTKTDTKKDLQVVKVIALEVKKLAEKTDKIKSLGVEIGENKELDNALAKIVEEEIKDLEARNLMEDQKDLLTKAKEDYQQGNYSQALEKILILSQ